NLVAVSEFAKEHGATVSLITAAIIVVSLSIAGAFYVRSHERLSYANLDEGILLLPGEDPFYYATGRRPQFPVLLFDRTVNPYSPEQIREICRERNIKWLIVKQDLQDEDDGVNQEEEQITAALEADFEQIDSVGNYEIYHRVDPNKKDEDDDDD